IMRGLVQVESELAPDTRSADGMNSRVADENRLQRLQSEIEELRAHILQAESSAGSLLGQLDEIDLNIALLRREAEALARRAEDAERAHQSARRRAAIIRRELETSEEAVRRWLLEVYKSGPTRYLRVMAASTSPSEVASAQRVVETLSLIEGERIETLRRDRARMETALAEITATRETLAALRLQVEERGIDLRRGRREKSELLGRIRDEQASQEEIMRGLVQVESELRSLLSSLPPQDGSRIVSRGFGRFRGLLEPPSRGSLLVPFGNVRHPRFQTEIPHPGIDLAAAPGDEVRVVFDGRVVFSSWFRGYGQLIVVDHADGYLSIYGHLGERLVEVGDEVYGGDVIARSGEGGTLDGPALYFEIRRDGEPEDPLPWLRPGSGQRYDRSRPGR
ncbi:MAG TPA: peptidoglycan DD-metalloendopeptidase family protein, partial [Candidatus Polarisedimenticolia bacterium]|nr:peptidoglycan DD-metalloendopeptidase family protein [Candidatus Polarisedimenticolia bacterium]